MGRYRLGIKAAKSSLIPDEQKFLEHQPEQAKASSTG